LQFESLCISRLKSVLSAKGNYYAIEKKNVVSAALACGFAACVQRR